jgi:GT2 family glycosyltransferase
MNQADILIIGIIYNTYPETLRYLDSCKFEDKENIKLILVDNSDKEMPAGFLEKIKSCPFLEYIQSKKNTGYFGGAREGLNHYLRQYADFPPWILVTNVDIVFTPTFFHQLCALDNRENLGIVAPSIISQKWKTDYNPKIPVRYSRRRIKIYQFLYSSFLIHNLFLLGAYTKKWIGGLLQGEKHSPVYPEPRVTKIYAPHGSCMIFSNAFFNSGGSLDLPNFLFGEEIFVAETAARLGLDVIYHPGLVIYDHEHASTGFFVTPGINRYYKEAIDVILDQFYQ